MPIQFDVVKARIYSDDPHNSWELSFDREGDQILIHLYWNKKETPTHTFSVSVNDFAYIVTTLLTRS